MSVQSPHSRYRFCLRQIDGRGRSFLEDRVPYRYRAFADNKTHVVQDGETLFTIAAKQYRNMPGGGSRLWWVIADFQPQPLHDPTLQLPAGSVLVIPSVRIIDARILNPNHRT